MEFNSELLPWLQTKSSSIGMPNKEVPIAMNTSLEFRLSAAGGSPSACSRRKLIALGFHKSSIEALPKDAATGAYITAASGNFILRTIAEGSCLV